MAEVIVPKILGKKEDDIIALLESNRITNPQLISMLTNILTSEPGRTVGKYEVLTASNYRKLIEGCIENKCRSFNNYLKFVKRKEYQKSQIVSILSDYAVVRSSVPRNHDYQCELVGEHMGVPADDVRKIATIVTDDSYSHPFIHDSIREYLVAKRMTELIYSGNIDDDHFFSMFDPGTHRFIAELFKEKIQRCDAEHWDPLEVSVGPLVDRYEKLMRSDEASNEQNGDRMSRKEAVGMILVDWIGRMATLDHAGVGLWVRKYISKIMALENLPYSHRWSALFSMTRAGDFESEMKAAELLRKNEEFAKYARLITIVYFQDAPYRLLTDGEDLPGLTVDRFFEEFMRSLEDVQNRFQAIHLNSILLRQLLEKGYKISIKGPIPKLVIGKKLELIIRPKIESAGLNYSEYKAELVKSMDDFREQLSKTRGNRSNDMVKKPDN